MNKLQFLAELTQYLTFLSPEERAKVIADYTKRFDEVGEKGEEALLLELGTPMLIAIDLKRQMESGKSLNVGTDIKPVRDLAKENELNAYNVETDTEETIFLDDDNAKNKPDDISLSKKVVTKRRGNSVFAVIGAALLSVIITVLFVVLAAVGVYFLIAMSYLLLGGLKSLYRFTDSLLLFSGGLICGAIGLLLVWFSVWSAISMIRKLFRSALGISGNSKESDTQ